MKNTRSRRVAMSSSVAASMSVALGMLSVTLAVTSAPLVMASGAAGVGLAAVSGWSGASRKSGAGVFLVSTTLFLSAVVIDATRP